VGHDGASVRAPSDDLRRCLGRRRAGGLNRRARLHDHPSSASRGFAIADDFSRIIDDDLHDPPAHRLGCSARSSWANLFGVVAARGATADPQTGPARTSFVVGARAIRLSASFWAGLAHEHDCARRPAPGRSRANRRRGAIPAGRVTFAVRGRRPTPAASQTAHVRGSCRAAWGVARLDRTRPSAAS